MTHLSLLVCSLRCPIVARLSSHELTVGRASRSECHAPWVLVNPANGAGNALPALVYKQVGVSFARVQLVEILRDDDAFGIRPRARADATARVGRLLPLSGSRSALK